MPNTTHIDTVYIKGRKIDDIEYSGLAAFFGERRIDRELWNAVLYRVAQSQDTAVRRLMLALVQTEAHCHAQFKKQREACCRARKIIHDTKRKTGRAGGIMWYVNALLLHLRHALAIG